MRFTYLLAVYISMYVDAYIGQWEMRPSRFQITDVDDQTESAGPEQIFLFLIAVRVPAVRTRPICSRPCLS